MRNDDGFIGAEGLSKMSAVLKKCRMWDADIFCFVGNVKSKAVSYKSCLAVYSFSERGSHSFLLQILHLYWNFHRYRDRTKKWGEPHVQH